MACKSVNTGTFQRSRVCYKLNIKRYSIGTMSRQLNFRKLTLIRMNLRDVHTGNERVDKVVHALGNGRAASALTAYEQFIGISDVKAAQNRVAEVEKEFLQVREQVAEANREVSGLQTKLHSLRGKLDRTPRDDPKFLELATEEHSMLQTETRLKERFSKEEARERDTFTKLSTAVRESHEKQRAQEERTKYWSVIGSIVGTLLGILGSSVVNHKRMRELKTLVSELSTGDFGSASTRQELTAIVKQLKESLGQDSDDMQHPNLENSMNDTMKRHDKLLSEQLKAIEKLMDERNSRLSDQIKGMRRSMTDVGDTGTLEELLSDTEQKLEWEMKMSTLSTVVFIYGAFALTLPILYSIFK